MKDWRKTHYPCHICDKKAMACLRPDMDIKGLCYCKKHEDNVRMAYLLLMQGNEKEAKKLLEKDK